MKIPVPIIATVSDALHDHYTHTELDNLFFRANAPGEPPVGNKKDKISRWLFRCNDDPKVDAIVSLGIILENFLEQEIPEDDSFSFQANSAREIWLKNRELIRKAFAKYGFTYCSGAIVRQEIVQGPSKTVEQLLKEKNLPAVDEEFKRTLANIESDPPAALTGACSIVEALCKLYIEAHEHLSLPQKQTISPLWEVVRKDLGLNPKNITDQDLLKIIQGTSSIVEGLGALRTHEGSAHGRGSIRYKLQPRHVRLAVHSAHTLVSFVIETWSQKG